MPNPGDFIDLQGPLKDAGKAISDAAKAAVADAAAKVVADAQAALSTATAGATDALAGTTPIPAVEGASSVKDSLQNGLSFLGDALQTQIVLSIKQMTALSADVAKASLDVVAQMEKLGRQVLAKQIGPESAQLALDNYLHALDLYKSALVNQAAVQAYERAKSLLETAKQVLFSLLRFGLEVASPAAATLLDKIGQAAVIAAK